MLGPAGLSSLMLIKHLAMESNHWLPADQTDPNISSKYYAKNFKKAIQSFLHR